MNIPCTDQYCVKSIQFEPLHCMNAIFMNAWNKSLNYIYMFTHAILHAVYTNTFLMCVISTSDIDDTIRTIRLVVWLFAQWVVRSIPAITTYLLHMVVHGLCIGWFIISVNYCYDTRVIFIKIRDSKWSVIIIRIVSRCSNHHGLSLVLHVDLSI